MSDNTTMTPTEQAEMLRRNVAGWNHWRSANLTARPDLSSADLSSADLSSANLTSANLRGANLRGANLTSADLSSADLGSANLSSANLRGADLSSANLTGANLRSANLTSANLSSADLSSANLRSANLTSANLSSANLSDVAGVIDGGTTVRGYRMIVVRHDNDVVVVSGCRALGSIEAKAHWSLGDRYVREHGYSVARRMKLRVRCLITEARAEGWIVAAPLEDSDYAFQSATNE